MSYIPVTFKVLLPEGMTIKRVSAILPVVNKREKELAKESISSMANHQLPG